MDVVVVWWVARTTAGSKERRYKVGFVFIVCFFETPWVWTGGCKRQCTWKNCLIVLFCSVLFRSVVLCCVFVLEYSLDRNSLSKCLVSLQICVAFLISYLL